jgi:hypothetical protein
MRSTRHSWNSSRESESIAGRSLAHTMVVLLDLAAGLVGLGLIGLGSRPRGWWRYVKGGLALSGVTAFTARSRDLVAGLRSAVDATLTELLTTRPEPDRVCPRLSAALTDCAVADDLGDAPRLLRAATDHARFGELAEARMLLVAGQHILLAVAARGAVVIPTRRDPVDAAVPAPTG